MYLSERYFIITVHENNVYTYVTKLSVLMADYKTADATELHYAIAELPDKPIGDLEMYESVCISSNRDSSIKNNCLITRIHEKQYEGLIDYGIAQM